MKPQPAIRNPQSEACPSAEELERFLRAVSDADEHAEIAAHLSACERCRARAEQLGEHAAWADQLRRANRVRAETAVDVNVPLARLNELLTEYEVIEEIGRGGMGIVFKARHLRLDRMVALKVLPALLGAVRPDAVGRFEREATLLARLQHTNIIPVFDYGQVDGTLYYTMPLIEGRSLRDVLREITETGAIDVVLDAGSSAGAASPVPSSQPSAIIEKQEATSERREAGGPQGGSPKEAQRNEGKPTSMDTAAPRQGQADIRRPTSITRIGSSSRSDRAYFRRVAKWIADVAEALDYAHEQDVIHRDVKPSNLLLAADGRLMISDFGLARASGVETLTATRSLLGTARYMSPEQVDESLGEIDRRVDVYGLGATLYELLAFRPMYAAADDREVLDCVLNKEPALPHRFVRQVPRELETICLKAVEKQRDARYETIKAMADDLRRWLLDLPIQARRPSLLVRVRKYIRRRKVPIALAGTSVVLLIVAGLLYARNAGLRHDAARAESVALSQHVLLLTQEAEAEWDAGHFAVALEKVEAGLAQEPDSLALQRLRAETLQMTGRLAEALDAYVAMLARHPDDWRTHYARALALTDRRYLGGAGYYPPDSVVGSMPLEEWERQLAQHREQVQRLKPDSAEALHLLAREQADPQRAIELLNEALERCPELGEALLTRSRRFEQIGDHEAMLLDAERAAAMGHARAATHGQRGLALYALSRYEEAERAFGEAIERSPESVVWWHNRGLAKGKLGRFAEALADASEAVRLDPDCAWAYVGRARAHAGLGKLDDALADLDRAIELTPTDVEIYLERADLHFHAGQLEKAIADTTRVIQLRQDDPRGYKSRAVEYMQAKQYERAITDLTHYLHLEPDNVKAYRSRGHAYIRIKHYTEAIADYTRAIELDPGFFCDFHNRANLHLYLGRYEDAIADLSRLIDLQTAPEVAVLKRGMAYELVGATRLALADYDKMSKQSDPGGEYARLWKYILLRESGQNQVAAELLPARNTAEDNDDWTDRLFELFSGGVSGEDLLAAAATEDERAEAHYYIGRQALLDGDRAAAREAFAACVALDCSKVLETNFAQALLKQLEERNESPQAAP